MHGLITAIFFAVLGTVGMYTAMMLVPDFGYGVLFGTLAFCFVVSSSMFMYARFGKSRPLKRTLSAVYVLATILVLVVAALVHRAPWHDEGRAAGLVADEFVSRVCAADWDKAAELTAHSTLTAADIKARFAEEWQRRLCPPQRDLPRRPEQPEEPEGSLCTTYVKYGGNVRICLERVGESDSAPFKVVHIGDAIRRGP